MMQGTQDVERWLSVPSYLGYYEVSDQGRVRSLDRVIIRNGHEMRLRGCSLRPKWAGVDGRAVVALSMGGMQQYRYIYHLVLEAFVGPRPEGAEACHADGNHLNNRLENLRWGSHSENQYDQVRHGTHVKARKTHCPLGHALASPNLVAVEARRGYRKCLACSRMNAALHRAKRVGDPFDPQVESDLRYERIMANTLKESA